MYIDNVWYGHRRILTEYCGEKDQPIIGSIQHGAQIDYLPNDIGKHSFPFAKYYCWSRKTYEISVKNNLKNVIPIGAPFLYLDKDLNKKTEAKGTLVFPAHSNPSDPRGFKHELFIKHTMDNFPGPYTACLFFLDLNEIICEKYKKFGWKVVSAGKRTDKNFLYKLYEFIASNEYSVSTELGTSFFYSLYLNRKTSYSYKTISNKKKQYFSQFAKNSFDLNLLKKYKKENNFLLNKVIDQEKGKKIADFELGKEFIKSKQELRKILGVDNKYKKATAYILAKLVNLRYNSHKSW